MQPISKAKTRIIAAVLTAVFLFSTVGMVTAYAKGGDYEPEQGSTPIEEPYIPPPVILETEDVPTTQPLTPPGTGTVIDNVTNENGIEFFTITSAAGNIFFLIIDRQRDNENVYFLNAVTERDLMALAEESGDDYWVISNAPPPIIPGDTQPAPEVEPEPEPTPEPEPESGGSAGMVILLIILALGGGAAGYYFKILRPKQQQADMGDDGFDYEDDYTDEADPYNEDEDDTPPWEVEEADTYKDGEE
jgi:hypothetical protein